MRSVSNAVMQGDTPGPPLGPSPHTAHRSLDDGSTPPLHSAGVTQGPATPADARRRQGEEEEEEGRETNTGNTVEEFLIISQYIVVFRFIIGSTLSSGHTLKDL